MVCLARRYVQIQVSFQGSASSQEINGSYGSVPCGKIFSNTSAATLGVGCTSQFTSSSTLTVRAVGRWASRAERESSIVGREYPVPCFSYQLVLCFTWRGCASYFIDGKDCREATKGEFFAAVGRIKYAQKGASLAALQIRPICFSI